MISKKKLEKFEKQINFYFKDKENLLKALIHPSYISETKLKKTDSNFERFEFLGDRVLGLSISSFSRSTSFYCLTCVSVSLLFRPFFI